MTTTTPASDRPLLVRAAHKWYSWAGLGVTVVGAYLTATGQLRVGDAPLRAAPPDAGVSWKPAAPTAEPAKFNGQAAPDDPFRAVVPPPAPPILPAPPSSPPPAPTLPAPLPKPEIVPPAPLPKPIEGPAVSPPIAPAPLPPVGAADDPFVASKDTQPLANTKVGEVLKAYVSDKPAFAEKPDEGPKLIKPANVEVPATKPGPKPEVPVALPRPDAVPPVGPPAVPAAGGAKLPPIPPAPGPLPIGRIFDVPAPIAFQDPETLTVQPKPVEAPPKVKEKKEPPPPKKRRIFGTLSQEDEIRLNAAQNAARLRDWNRSAALLAEIIVRYPKEYDLRAELAGWLIAAGDYRRGVVELEQVVRLSPNSVGYRVLLGDAYMGARNYKAAAAVYWSAVEMVQNDPRLADRLPELIIRTARAYALDNDVMRAAQLVDKYLSSIRPDDENAPTAMGAMLLDLDRPYDALPYLIEKRKQMLASPEATEEYELKFLEVLASMVRGFARVGDRQQAMEAVKEMDGRAPQQTGIRIALADILFETNEHDLAGHVYNQVLAVDPANAAGLIGIARVYLETVQPAAAKRVLDSFVPNAANQRNYLLAYSSYHQAIGETTEAKQIYKDMLRRNENDHEVRFALGRIYDYTNEWEKAKAEFAKIPPQDKMGRRARYWFGMTLLHQRKFADAAGVAEQFMADDPTNPDGLALYVRALAKMGQFDKAVQAGRGYLTLHQRDDRRTVTVRLAVARALLEANRNLDAAREYELVLSRPAGRVPEAYYGLSRAAEKLGNVERAAQIIGTLCGTAGIDVRSKLLLADFYAADFEDQKVIELMAPLATSEPNNLAVLIRLADAQQRASKWSGNPADAFGTCQNIIRQSPTNVRGLTCMARSFGLTQNYRKAAVQYDQVIAIDPEYTIPQRERARILHSDHQFSAARSQYNVLLSPTPEDIVTGEMGYYAQRDAKLRQAFGPYLGGHMNGAGLRSELARLAAGVGDEDVRIAAHRLICDYDSTLAWQEAIRLERDGKELKDYRNYMAIPQYNAANQFEPANTETLFDEGQAYGALKMTRAALTWYSNTIAVDPTHRDAIVASERAGAEISPKLDLRYDWFRQRGRGGLASIDRQRILTAASLPLGDENEYLQLGYYRIQLAPIDDGHVWGNAPFVRVQKKFDDNRLMAYGQVNIEQYKEGFSTRPTFDIGAWYDHDDVLRCRAGTFLENVAETGESIRQDIFRYGFYAGADVKPTRTWGFGGTYTFAHYSDNNDMHQGSLFNQVALTLPPKMIKLVQQVNMWSYREQTEFPGGVPVVGPGVVHPYFVPDFFVNWECRVEWWHWLSRDYFTHSNQCWYSLQYGFITDNDLVTYQDFRAILNYDISSRVSVGAEGRALISSGDVYNMYAATAYVQFRFGP